MDWSSIGETAINTGGNFISNLITGLFNNRAKRKAAERQFQMQRQLNSEADQYQRNLISDLPTMNRAAMQNAGFSVASLNNAFNTASTNASPTAPSVGASEMSPVDFAQMRVTTSQLATEKKNRTLIDEQIKKTESERLNVEADTAAKELENTRNARVYDDEDKRGKYLWSHVSDFVNSIFGNEEEDYGGEKLDGVTVTAKKPEPRYISEETFRVMTGELFDKMNTGFTQRQSERLENFLKQGVTNLQLSDTELIKKMADLPRLQYDSLNRTLLLAIQEYKFLEKVNPFRVAAEKYGVDKAIADIMLTKANIDKTKSEKESIDKNLKLMDKQYGKLSAEEKKIVVDTALSALELSVTSNTDTRAIVAKAFENGELTGNDVLKIIVGGAANVVDGFTRNADKFVGKGKGKGKVVPYNTGKPKK